MKKIISRILRKLKKNSHTAILVRYFSDYKQGTFGRIFINGKFICYTVEQPWNDNIPYKSCVPVGTYKLLPFKSLRFGQTWQLENRELKVFSKKVYSRRASDRFACQFHVANYASDVSGCIGPGTGRASYKGIEMVTNSKISMDNLRLKFIEFGIDKLIIKDEYELGDDKNRS